MISLRNVSRTFLRGASEIHAVRDTCLEVGEDEAVAIRGPSGSGKTTLLSLIGTLDRPTAGIVRIDGTDVWSLPDRKRAFLRATMIGFIFQSYNLIPELSAWRNVSLPLRYGGVDARTRRRRAIAALAAVGLEERIHHLPAQLSGGEEQRVAIARSMVIHPRLLLGDEPTGNLDSRTGTQIMSQILTLRENGRTTLLLVTHDAELAARCPREFEMRDGKLYLH